MEKTLKQIADEIGVDKQRVYRFVRRNNINEARQENGTMMYDEAAQSMIFQYFFGCERINEANRDCDKHDANDAVDAANERLIKTLQDELEMKNQQIVAQQEQITQLTAALEHTTASLHAAQALHAGTMQQIASASEDDVEQMGDVSAQQSEERRRWWQFWR